ncbi:putative undecaprenol kinase [Parvibaculum lavamentivorans DS-1]|uniref:Undecaprenyl-diphosphatase n=1 Tax=Parvibaculum lavamentivorans (strain DS-1 / DSM 13023 / NCIMB 13966) TaxID=402881 RepID=UPPP_PARL1|nr:undecaprenyl-diphosphate phosphatase [Parvibaculum lavamentivorans]A7HS58.1 RecName: Full=Undecaprenyl-diphosphatase; AltName: Full=Bacitracin resistance protein; AltName: Full=Undecaprenyl pyrophosphate phosphatase [Parvibaculum lavamentivorans DS-1]ABS62741.1 putative undecaprenol kinase [Parvibaculum lavamentivorans DS-1]
MNDPNFLHAIILGIVEGVSEFLPISSTGHLIIVGELLGFSSVPGKVFEVVIQLGAILAICVLYSGRLTRVLRDAPRDAGARNFIGAIFVALIPAGLLGVLYHDFILEVLFTPYVVCAALITGGIAIVVVERLHLEPRITSVEAFSMRTALKIGLFQCIALVPGVSRSGATILGALLVGVERKTAAEFSFFLAIPVMLGASVVSLRDTWQLISMDDLHLIAAGFIAAFISALLVVKWLVSFVSSHGFTVFGWYRILFGSLLLIYFSLSS